MTTRGAWMPLETLIIMMSAYRRELTRVWSSSWLRTLAEIRELPEA